MKGDYLKIGEFTRSAVSNDHRTGIFSVLEKRKRFKITYKRSNIGNLDKDL